MTQGLIGLLAFVSTTFSSYPTIISPVADNFVVEERKEVLALQSLDLTQRDKNEFVNEVFKDNILLALRYLNDPFYLEYSERGSELDWDKIKRPFEVSFILQPGEVFAFHDNVLSEFKIKVAKTMNSHFIGEEGYRNSGYVYGDGVCHLASLINWVASEAGLEVVAKANHNFRLIPEIPKEYGTSIRYCQTGCNSQNQNLYVKNNLDSSVEFRFKVSEEKVELAVARE